MQDENTQQHGLGATVAEAASGAWSFSEAMHHMLARGPQVPLRAALTAPPRHLSAAHAVQSHPAACDKLAALEGEYGDTPTTPPNVTNTPLLKAYNAIGGWVENHVILTWTIIVVLLYPVTTGSWGL